MRDDMAGWLVTVLLLPGTWMVVMTDTSEETESPPDVRVRFSDGLVMVQITSSEQMHKVVLRKNGSAEEVSEVMWSTNYIIPPLELLPGETYCVKVGVYDTMMVKPFSPEQCFTAPPKAPPYNVRMDALDLMYLLRWDWDFERSPDATFSVDSCHNLHSKTQCTRIPGCENITTPQCDSSGLSFRGKHILRVSVYDGRREEKKKSSSAIQFSPFQDTIISPPKDVKMRLESNELFVNVSAPEWFKYPDLYDGCVWVTHLEYWVNSTHDAEVMVQEEIQPFFRIESLEDSTTYCAKAKMKCRDSNRSSLYGEEYCITSDPRSYLVAWIIGFSFLAIVVISVVLYICLCPLKRYIKHIFFPSSKLPSSIEKGFRDSSLDCIQHSFLVREEEPTDHCYIVYGEDSGQISYNNASQGNSQDSGNYSNEGPNTGEVVT